MMLTRRMIRQCFVYSAEKKWNARLMENISNIFDVTVIGASCQNIGWATAPVPPGSSLQM